MSELPRIRATTILAVRRGGAVAIGGDGQVTVGETIMKAKAQKVRALKDGRMLAGFAGSAADALTLFEKFEEKLERYPGNLSRAAVELAKDWRSDPVLRRLGALLAVAHANHGLVVSGTGEIIDPAARILARVGWVGREEEELCRARGDGAMEGGRREREGEVEARANGGGDDGLLVLLLPPPAAVTAPPNADEQPTLASAGDAGGVFVVSPAGDVKQEGASEVTQDRYKRTRDKLRGLLLDGQLEQREVEIEVTPGSSPMFDMFASQGAPGNMENFTDMLREMMPQRKKKRTVKVSEARRILLEQEFDRLVDMEDVTADALERVETLGIVFLDEIDKIAGEKSQMGALDDRQQIALHAFARNVGPSHLALLTGDLVD